MEINEYIESIQKKLDDTDKELAHLSDEEKMLNESYDKNSEGYKKQIGLITVHRGMEEENKKKLNEILDNYNKTCDILKDMEGIYPDIRREDDPKRKDELNKKLDEDYQKFTTLKGVFPNNIQNKLEDEIINISKKVVVKPVLPKNDTGLDNVIITSKGKFTLEDIKNDLEKDKKEVKRLKTEKDILKEVDPNSKDYEDALKETKIANQRLEELSANEDVYFHVINIYDYLGRYNHKRKEMDKYKDQSIKNATLREVNNLRDLIEALLDRIPKSMQNLVRQNIEGKGYVRYDGLYLKETRERENFIKKIDEKESKSDEYSKGFEEGVNVLKNQVGKGYDEYFDNLEALKSKSNPYDKEIKQDKENLKLYDEINSYLDDIESYYMDGLTKDNAPSLMSSLLEKENFILKKTPLLDASLQRSILTRRDNIKRNREVIKESNLKLKELYEKNIEVLYKNDPEYINAPKEEKNNVLSQILFKKKDLFLYGISVLDSYVTSKKNIPGIVSNKLDLNKIRDSIVDNKSAYAIYLGVSNQYKNGYQIGKYNNGYEPILNRLEVEDTIDRVISKGINFDDKNISLDKLDESLEKAKTTDGVNKKVKAKKIHKKINRWSLINLSSSLLSLRNKKPKKEYLDETFLNSEEFSNMLQETVDRMKEPVINNIMPVNNGKVEIEPGSFISILDSDGKIVPNGKILKSNTGKEYKLNTARFVDNYTKIEASLTRINIDDELSRCMSKIAKSNTIKRKNKLKNIISRFKKAKDKFKENSEYEKALEKVKSLEEKEMRL